MTIRNLVTRTVGIGLLLLAGCEAPRNMRDDYLRLTTPEAAALKAQAAKSTPPRPRATPAASTTDVAAVLPPPPSDEPLVFPSATAASGEPPARPAAALSLVAKSEIELRAMFGAPTTEEDTPPGKRWRYHDGQCTLDVQLYPDIKTRQFGVLAYEVKSYDNTDEGRRVCTAQLQSRAQALH
jgi:hypothetical protein